MIPTPGQPDKYYGIGAVNYHTGESVVLFQRRKRRKEIAQLLEALMEKHPTGTIYVAWDNANTRRRMMRWKRWCERRQGVSFCSICPRTAAFINPIEMLWRHFRREVTHCEFFETKQALLSAAQQCIDRFNQCPQKILSVIGSNAQNIA
jgi:putative transposase